MPTDNPSLEGAALEYRLQRPFFSWLGARCTIRDSSGSLVLFARRKAFRLREDIQAWEDEGATREALRIRTESILDLGATYWITDSRSGEPVGGARRKFLRSVLRDEWELLGAGGETIGTVIEDSTALALIRRFLTNLVPQSYTVQVGERVIGEIRQAFNPFLFRARLRLAPGRDAVVDRRLLFGLGILLMTIEGRQES